MTGEAGKLVEKGRRSLAAAEQLYKSGDYDFSASRAYYAMFYLAEAALLAKGLAFSKHAQVIAAFSEHLVKTGHVPRRLHQAFYRAFELRNRGDYAAEPFPAKEAKATLDAAREFITALLTHLKHPRPHR
jgi:uncharacterized protein (UPF0332 family)